MEAQRKIQPLVCGNPCWSGSVALEEVLSEARQRQRRDPPCHVHLKRSRWPANTNSPVATCHTHTRTHTPKKKKPCRWHKETHFDCDRLAKAALQRRDLFLKMFPNVSRLSRANLMRCPPGSLRWALVYSEKEEIWGKNQLEVRDKKKKPRRRPKQKAGEKCSVSRRLQTAPGV